MGKIASSDSGNVSILCTAYGEKCESLPVRKVSSENFFTAVRSLTLGDWIFRGQGDASWGLEPSIERTCRRIWMGVDDRKLVHHMKEFEQFTIEQFQRRAGLYLGDKPQPNDLFEWLALMQHHGVPTRLLDFTRSPFIVLFAIHYAVPGKDCSVWAINRTELVNTAFEVLASRDVLVAGRELLDLGTQTNHWLRVCMANY